MEGKAECPEKKIPSLAPVNYEIWTLFQLMIPGLITQGGYDYTAIEVVFNTYDIDKAQRQKMLPQIIKLIDVIMAERRSREK